MSGARKGRNCARNAIILNIFGLGELKKNHGKIRKLTLSGTTFFAESVILHCVRRRAPAIKPIPSTLIPPTPIFMKTLYSLILAMGFGFLAAPLVAQEADESLYYAQLIDSLEHAWKWQTGAVPLGEGLATLNVPTGWRYLPGDQGAFVLSDLWGNPPSETLGMLFPDNIGPLDSATLAFNITFDELGYVKDEDADDIDYDDLLKDMKKEAVDASKEREKMGYGAIEIIGWASAPYYDKTKKALHWAKELHFGDADAPHTLNYDVRLLGRKGVLSMNAVADMGSLAVVKSTIPAIVNNVRFADGNRYSDFDPGVDEVAAWTIGGLVAGKVLAKAGFFAVMLKFIKPILLVLVGGGAAAWRWITGRRKEDEAISDEETA